MSEHTLTDESRELVEDLEHRIGTDVLSVIDQLRDIERAAAERAREGHIREFLASEARHPEATVKDHLTVDGEAKP